MKYLLDTDVIIYWIKGIEAIEEKVMTEGLGNIRFSIVSKAELWFGAYNSIHIEKNMKNIEKLCTLISVLPFCDLAAEKFGKIKAGLKKSGKLIADADIMVASISLANNMILITNNERHFQRIPDLKIENWMKK
ncbi:MAG: PIN domain-containing protein [Desulfococcaceae bacterium]